MCVSRSLHRAVVCARNRHGVLPLEGVDEVDRDVLVPTVRGDVEGVESVPVGETNVSAEPHKQLDEFNVAIEATLGKTKADT